MRSPFINARVTESSETYLDQEGKRGEPDFVMSRSQLIEFARCPHRWLAGYTREDSDATDFGSMIDTMLLTPQAFGTKYVVRPAQYPAEVGSKKEGYRTEMRPWTMASNWCKAWAAKNGDGRELLDPADYHVNTKLVERLREDFPWLKDCKTQVMVTADYIDAATKLAVPVKILIDAVPLRDSLLDFKTCRSAVLETWQRFVFGFGYHVQAALYLDVWNAANPLDERADFRHFGCENTPPFEPFGPRILSQEFIEIGRTFYRAALARYCRCLTTGHWPGLDETTNLIDCCPLIEPLPWMVNAGLHETWHPEPDLDAKTKLNDDIIP